MMAFAELGREQCDKSNNVTAVKCFDIVNIKVGFTMPDKTITATE